MQTYSIPIRFSWEEKHALEQEAKKANLPLSTYIRKQMQSVIAPQIKNINKSTILISKLKLNKIEKNELEMAEKEMENFRKNFKLTSSR
jgi:hypothetical protein